MELSKRIFIKDFLVYLRFLEFFTFIIANFIIACIFYLLLNTFNVWILVIFLSSFIMSLLILKNNWLFLLFTKKRTNSSIETTNTNENVNISLKTFFIVFFKQFFFNISYELFPLLIIWISWFGIWYILINLGFFNITTSVIYVNFNVYTFHFKSQFFQVITVIGILLGVYQFYLSRQEQKVLSKINFYLSKIKQVIFRETTFDKYLLYVSQNYDSNFVKWITDNIDPKMLYFTFFKELHKDPEAYDGLKHLLFPQRYDRKFSQQPLINLQLMYKDTNQKFETIESRAKIDGREQALKKSYTQFFTHYDQINRLMKEMNNEIDFSEFNILLISNINIIQEITPEFISPSLNKTVGDVFGKKMDLRLLFEKCITSTDYREVLEFVIMKENFDKFNG